MKTSPTKIKGVKVEITVVDAPTSNGVLAKISEVISRLCCTDFRRVQTEKGRILISATLPGDAEKESFMNEFAPNGSIKHKGIVLDLRFPAEAVA